ARVPVLGVCLGFQQMAVAAGGSVVRAARPAHGVIERVTHDGSALFDGVPAAFDAVRYHSLVVAEPAPFDITARAGDGTPMAGAAPERSWFGVQFHPESIASEHGSRIVDAFLRMGGGRGVARVNPIREQQFTQGEPWRLWSERIPALPDASAIFEACCGGAETAVWLDSAQPAYGMGRWSLLGVPDGPRDHVLAYDAATGSMTRDGAAVRGDVWDALAREIDAHPVEAGDLPFAG